MYDLCEIPVDKITYAVVGEDLKFIVEFDTSEEVSDSENIRFQMRYGEYGTDGASEALFTIEKADMIIDSNIISFIIPTSITSSLDHSRKVLWQIELTNNAGFISFPNGGVLVFSSRIVRGI